MGILLQSTLNTIKEASQLGGRKSLSLQKRFSRTYQMSILHHSQPFATGDAEELFLFMQIVIDNQTPWTCPVNFAQYMALVHDNK
jgi:hypothetical protein